MPQDISTTTRHPEPGTFAGHDSFAAIVKAHLPWVHAMARRQLGDASLAEDAAQVVFLSLWRSRQRLRRGIGVGGWLMRATQYACNDLRKTEHRRKQRERKVAAMRAESSQSPDGAAPESDAAVLMTLDTAMHRLSAKDRGILVARFFQNQSARQIAEQLQISEVAAEKRLTRAVTKLRGIIAQKNISLDNMAIIGLLTGGAGTAPSGLLEKVIQVVGGKAAMSVAATHAARSVALHSAHIPVIAGTVAVVLAVGVAAVAPIAIRTRQVPVNPATAEVAPSRQAAAANSTAAPFGVLTCVAYDMLVQRDFAWAVKNGGRLLSGRPGGVQAYGISARVVRALARAQSGGVRLVLGSKLNWLSRPLPILLSRGNYPPPAFYRVPVNFFLRHTLVRRKVLEEIFVQMGFQWHDQAYPDAMRLQVKFKTGANISVASNIPISGAHLPYVYQGKLSIAPGRSVVLLRRVMNFQGTRWYSVVVFEVQRYPYDLLPAVNTLTGVGRYIKSGPAGLEHIAAVASAWARHARAHPPKSEAEDVRWTKALPDGISVTLQGISNGVWPLCPWTPTAVPLSAPYEYLSSGQMAGLLEFKWPINYLWRYPGIQRGQKTMTGSEWARIPGRTNTWSIGLDSGKWKIIGSAKPSATPQWNFTYKGYKFGAFEIAPLQADPSTHMPARIYMNLWTPSTPGLADQAIAVGAVTRQGKLVSPLADFFGGMTRFQTSRSNAINEYNHETIPISLVDVKRYVWITRPRHWVTFRGFALQPSPLPSTVFALQQQQAHAVTTKPADTAKPIAHVAANQTTPAGLMVLLGRAMRSANPLALQKLGYAPTSAERHLLAVESQLVAAQNSFGHWAAARKRFGVAQMQAAGLGEFFSNPVAIIHFPKHWKIKGAYATPLLPLPPNVSWPEKGQPLHSLIKKNGLWYLDFNLTKAQINQINAQMQRSLEVPSRNAKAYHAVMRQLQAGRIKDAYTLRDDLEAALRRFSTSKR
jgi:RNA polymerase sigma factor (sigma-70 family)